MICCFRDEAKLNVHGYPNATHQSFPTRAQAEAYIKGATIPIASTRAEPYSSRNRVNKVNKGQKDNTPLTPVQTQVRELVLDKINCDPEDHKKICKVYTDGASRGNGRANARAGFGVYYGDNDKRNVSCRLEGSEQTNQRAELTAINVALQRAKTDKPMRLVILTDSKYSINCFTLWASKWELNGWKNSAGQPVKNKDLIQTGRQLLQDLGRSNILVEFKHVKGHANIYGNEMADRLATLGADSG